MHLRATHGHFAALAAALLAGVVGACSGGSSPSSTYEGGDDSGLASGSSGGSSGACATCAVDGSLPQALFFNPPLATVVIDGTGPKTTSFTLVASDANGHTSNVTADAVDFDRPDLATVAIGEPIVTTAPAQAGLYAGTGTIHALYHGQEATAQLTVQVQAVDYGTGLSATSPAVMALNGTTFPRDPATAISPLLYPYDQTVWPLGFASPLLMWNAPQAGDVYHLQYTEKNYTFDGYYTLASLPGQMRLPEDAWDRITASNDAKHGPDPITFSMDRWDSVGNMAYATTTETWTVAPESLQGAIYYFSAAASGSATVGQLERLVPGTGAAPVALGGGKCMGCHAVNAQGTVLAADVDDGDMDGMAGATHTTPSVTPYDDPSGTRAWAAFDLTQPSAPLAYQSNEFGADLALTPDGTLVVFGGPATPAGSKYLSLGDVTTGAVVAASGLDAVTGFSASATNLEMPAFSPDGSLLAVVESSSPGDRDNVVPRTPETIAYLAFHQSGGAGPAFDPALHPVADGTSSVFATTGGGLGYPAFTPDSTAIAFHAGHTSTGCAGTCDGTTAADESLTTVDDGNLFVVTLAAPPSDAGTAEAGSDGGLTEAGEGGTEGGALGAGPGAPIRLAAACDPPNTADDNASVEPAFNPDARGGYSWAVFTSLRAWGNQPWPSGVSQSGHVNGKRRLWLTPLDATIGTTDPSHPAIYLEGQSDAPNMRGLWARASCIATPGRSAPPDAGGCTNGVDCCSGFCKSGVCFDPNAAACAGLGGACATAADCCNASSVSCTAGACAAAAQ